MTWLWIIILLLAGISLLILEIVVIPGITIAGILGVGLYGFGIWSTYSTYGSVVGHLTLGISLLVAICAFVYFLRSKAWNRFKLKDQLDGRVNTIDEEKIKVGDRGITISRLAPSGKALFQDIVYEVHCMNDLFDAETEVEVIRIEGNKITVKKIN